MTDSIENLKKICIEIQNQYSDDKSKELINNMIESFLWANGLVCFVKLDHIIED